MADNNADEVAKYQRYIDEAREGYGEHTNHYMNFNFMTNGAAAVALLAFIGALPRGDSPSDLHMHALIFFIGGLVITGFIYGLEHFFWKAIIMYSLKGKAAALDPSIEAPKVPSDWHVTLVRFLIHMPQACFIAGSVYGGLALTSR